MMEHKHKDNNGQKHPPLTYGLRITTLYDVTYVLMGNKNAVHLDRRLDHAVTGTHFDDTGSTADAF